MSLLEVENLRTYFYTRGGVIRAVNDVSFSLSRGETLGIVGESGSGKSVTCYSILGLIPKPPGKIVSGHANFGGVDLLNCPEKQLRQIRGKRISMIFQDPMTSLNPYMRVSDQLVEPLLVHEKMSRCTSARQGDRQLGRSRHPGCGEPDQSLSSPVLRGYASAGDDCDGIDQPAGDSDCR